ncbi:MAG TPA: hypothetical protein PK770_03775 [Kiritimatiellia bacterium]|jgi:HSP20 family molecular chaperone IbpA|nr:hypothetical protein [Kiritimatiellia bacterium]
MTMRNAKFIGRAWAALDYFLLVAVLGLLVTLAFLGRSVGEAAADGNGEISGGTEPVERVRPFKSRVVEGLRVSAGRQRLDVIAQSMAASDWDRLPASPALDMRENGQAYEILFSLPSGVDRDNVRVTSSGSLLTLALTDPGTGKVLMRRIRIPCEAEPNSRIHSVVSNRVLHVRIYP